MNRPLTLLFAAACALPALAQPELQPSIGLGAMPADSDPVCALPLQTPPIQNVGRPEGEHAADLTLYDIDGNAFNLEEELLLGKPVLMISASYTCPVFRSRIPRINQVVATYGSLISTVIVYTVEAHPYLDISPYFGAVNTGAQNTSAGILYQQPDTYGERKAVLQDLLDGFQIDAPVYLDGPCNEWWNYYGPQPNNAYLIGTDGVIHTHHDWFDRTPENIDCDLQDLLGLPMDCDQVFGGQFSIQMVSNDTIYGDAGTTITGHATLTNTTTEDCLVRIVKMQTNMPTGWQTSLCADVCYLPDVDTALVDIPANSTMEFYYYFYTNTAGTGYTRVGFRNESDNSNSFMREFWGIAELANAILDPDPFTTWSVFPNPASDIVRVRGLPSTSVLVWRDASGRVVRTSRTGSVSFDGLEPGTYFLQAIVNGAPTRSMDRLVVH